MQFLTTGENFGSCSCVKMKAHISLVSHLDLFRNIAAFSGPFSSAMTRPIIPRICRVGLWFSVTRKYHQISITITCSHFIINLRKKQKKKKASSQSMFFIPQVSVLKTSNAFDGFLAHKYAEMRVEYVVTSSFTPRSCPN